MAETRIFHALGLHMHQPPGNLRLLLDSRPRDAEEILRCYERPIRYAERYTGSARLHIGFSGILLEQLLDPLVVERARAVVDIPRMLARYRDASNIELVGMGYYHPIFPVIPRDDWLDQLQRGRAMIERVFGRVPRGFWPPEMAFSMDMIPALIQAGYDYAVVDGGHVRPEDGMSDVFRPYLACHEGLCIRVIPQDRDISRAQSTGMDPQWLADEMQWRVSSSPRPHEDRLLTTWSDGENGAWLRQTHEPSGFFGHFFGPCMEACEAGGYPIQLVLLSDYLEQVPGLPRAEVQAGAWKAGGDCGDDAHRWAASAAQRDALEAVRRLSAWYWELCREHPGAYDLAGEDMMRARRLILEAETSCFLCWGDAWLPHLYARIGPAEATLRAVEARLAASRQSSDEPNEKTPERHERAPRPDV